MKSQALAPQTGRIIEAISRLECIKPFVLVGGTALSIQLKTRQSEDLDFRVHSGTDPIVHSNTSIRGRFSRTVSRANPSMIWRIS